MLKDEKLYRILVIEDNRGDLTIVEDFLTDQITAPVIVHAGNFRQAAQIMSEHPPFDVILLDLSLPDKDRKNLVAEMLQRSDLCPIIILTGYADIGFSIKSISQGILDYLLKDDLNSTTLYKSIVYAIERKKTISDLKESEKRYSELFHLSPQPMWVFEVETFRFVQVNKAAIALYGYSEEEFLQMKLMDIKLEEDVPWETENLRNEKAGDVQFKDTVKHYKKSGEIIEVEIYSNPILVNDKKFRSVIAIDVTEKNLYEQKILKAIIKTQEDERYEIGGELHDNVCQILAASQISLGILKESLPSAGMSLFNNCKDNIKLALDEIRNLSHQLAPVFFDNISLEEAFKRLFKSLNIDKKSQISVCIDPELMGRDIHLNLYRILQEQLRNILKYAKAKLIEVDVLIDSNNLTMRIADDGVGFKVNTVKNGIGLANMKRRAELFSGTFELISSPGNGCVVLIKIPLETNSLHLTREHENRIADFV